MPHCAVLPRLNSYVALMPHSRTRTGQIAEAHALAHYRRQGYELIEQNPRTRYGEIDLIVANEKTLVIAEVRARVEGRGDPLESFSGAKRKQVRRMAASWLASDSRMIRRSQIRLDAVAVTVTAAGALVSLQVLEGAL
jgi:putative endonuclease